MQNNFITNSLGHMVPRRITTVGMAWGQEYGDQIQWILILHSITEMQSILYSFHHHTRPRIATSICSNQYPQSVSLELDMMEDYEIVQTTSIHNRILKKGTEMIFLKSDHALSRKDSRPPNRIQEINLVMMPKGIISIHMNMISIIFAGT